MTKPHIYYYNDDDQELPFPGEKMSPNGGNNRYVYTIYGVNNPRTIFNNNTTDPATRQKHPGINHPGIETTEDEMWVVNETAYMHIAKNHKESQFIFIVRLIGSIGIQGFTSMKIIIF